nr:EKC/KEOPS complex subunit LAGE3-like [Dasypus novemcinctus]
MGDLSDLKTTGQRFSGKSSFPKQVQECDVLRAGKQDWLGFYGNVCVRLRTLAVHFLSFLEAEVALRSLLTAPFGGPDHRELRVDGSDLIVHLNADDPGTLQSSIISFLNDLAEVVRTMEDTGPPFFNNSLLLKGA